MKDIAQVMVKTVQYLFLCAVFIFVVISSYWLLYPYTPIEAGPITIVNHDKTVKAGGTLLYTFSYDKHTDLPSVIQRQLIDTYTITYADAAGISAPGKDTVITHLPIPKYATPGVYYLRWQAVYQVNPLRKVTVRVDSEKFTVSCKNDTDNGIDDVLVPPEAKGG